MHIILHHGNARADVYRRIFQVLWFGNKLGQPSVGKQTPTYVYPDDLKTFIRKRFPSDDAGGCDHEFVNATDVTTVTWEDLANAKWPKPPSACKACNAKP